MAEISQVQVLDGSVYDLKDSTARSTLENVSTRTPIALGVKSLTSSGGTVTWTSDNILSDSIVHIYASIYGITATDVSVSAGTLTASFPAASSSYIVNATVDGTATVSGGSSGSGSGDSSAGVSSFNGRSGIVVPLTGDYSYSMISGTPSNATTSTAGLMSAADKEKLDGIATGATKNTATATIDAAGLMSAEDKSKLDNLVAQSESATAGVSSFNSRSGAVIPQTGDYSFSMISGSVDLSQLPDVTTKVSDATTSAAGLLSADDKGKLDKFQRLITQTLNAGSTTLSWTSSYISSTSLIEVYASIYGIAPTSVVQNGTTVTVTFKAQSSDMDVCITIENK